MIHVTHQMPEPYWATAMVGMVNAGTLAITFPITQPHVWKVRFSVKRPKSEVADKIKVERVLIAMCALSVQFPLSALDKLTFDIHHPGDFTLDLQLSCAVEGFEIELHEVRP